MSSSKGLAILLLSWSVLMSGAGLACGQDSRAAEKAAREKHRSDSDEASPESAPGNLAGPAKLLSGKGLTKKDRHFVLDETAAIEKFNQATSQRFDFQKALQHSNQIASFDGQIQEIHTQIQMLQQDVTATQAQLNNRMSGGYGTRRARGFVNQQQAPIRIQQNAEKAQIGQLNAQLKAANAKAPKKDERTLATSELERTRQSYVATVVELDALVAPLTSQYHELAKDKAIIQALEKVSHDDKKTYKLGPSAEVASAVKMIAEVKKSLPRSSKPSTKASTKAKSKSVKSPF